jgi:tetratricopeptide (TPR) repeat protein
MKKHPGRTLYAQVVAVVNNNIAEAWVTSRASPRDAQLYSARALTLDREIADADADNAQVKINLALALSLSGRISEMLCDRREALRLFNEAVGIFEEARKRSPDAPLGQSRIAYQRRADASIAAGDFGTALSDIRKEVGSMSGRTRGTRGRNAIRRSRGRRPG